MAEIPERTEKFRKVFTLTGYVLVVLFFLASVIQVWFFRKSGTIFDTDTRVITISHWQLEDGFREGLDEVIRRFEELKASQGVKVKIIQSTVPTRGYDQWMTTQLVGKKPVDIMELRWNEDMKYQYFYPLSPYIGKKNPYNAGTPVENYSWKNSFIDEMKSSLSWKFAEYFGVGCFFFTGRLFVNMDLLEKITGSRHLPEDLNEWLDICRQVKEYGEKKKIPMAPIGVRGLDKLTVSWIYERYYSELNSYLIDDFCIRNNGDLENGEILQALYEGRLDPRRLFANIEICRDVGQFFSEGFTAIDLEQSKYKFSKGEHLFIPEGTYNAVSIISNSPFEVRMWPIPPIGKTHKFSRWFTGKISESGVYVTVSFGITKTTKNFDLCLEFLQFMTSWRMNQLFAGYPQWGPAVKFVEYSGSMKDASPNMDGNKSATKFPLHLDQNSKTKALETIEYIIVHKLKDPVSYFVGESFKNKQLAISEAEETVLSSYRAIFSHEQQRSQLAIGIMRDGLSETERRILKTRDLYNNESYVDRIIRIFMFNKSIKYLKLIRPKDIRI